MAEPKVVTLQDVAELVGVHKSTVHRALRGDPRVDPGTAERIRATATRLGYDPDCNQAARRLSLLKSGRREPTKLIALLFPTVSTQSSYFQRMFMSFVETVSEAGCDVLVHVHSTTGVRLPPAVTRGDVDAVVTLTGVAEQLVIQAALAATPTVLRPPLVTLIDPIPGAWTVTADLRQGGRLAMEHLLDLGHRRIISSGKHTAFGCEERLAGCREALTSRGLDPDRHLTVVDADLQTPRSQRLSVMLDRQLSVAPDATAVLAAHDKEAQALLPLCAERGRPVPERMSLIGFDDTDPILGADHQNILTSIALPLEQIGREAAYMAMDPGDKPRRIMLPVGLRVRGTTGQPFKL